MLIACFYCFTLLISKCLDRNYLVILLLNLSYFFVVAVIYEILDIQIIVVKSLCCKCTNFFFLGLWYNTSLRHADLREYCSYRWADRLDRTAHNADKYLKQSIKIMLSIRLWKWKHSYFHIYDNAHWWMLCK